LALFERVGSKLLLIPLSKLTNVAADIITNDSEFTLSGLNTTDYFCLFVGVLLLIVPVWFWWIKIKCGLKNLLIDRPNKVLIISSSVYWAIKIFIILVILITTAFSEMQRVRNSTQSLNDELKKNKPNKLIVLKTTWEIYQEKKMPVQVRYKIGLMNLACACEVYFPTRFKGMFKGVYELVLKGREYNAELLMTKKINGFREKNIDQSHQLYLSLNKELKDLEELKNSNESPDAYALTKQTDHLIMKTADLKRMSNTNIIYSKKLAHWAEDDKVKIVYSANISYPIYQIFPF